MNPFRSGATLLLLISCTLAFAQKKSGINELKTLNKIDTVVGKGEPVKNGDRVYVIYRGTLKNGTEFDSNTAGSASPYSFIVGNDNVIKGWHMGIVGMKVGGTRKLEIPDEFAYGNEANGEKIAANSDLYFEIKLLHVIRPGEENYYDTEDLKAGSGKAVQQGSLVEVTYKAKLLNGRVFEDRSKKPVMFRVGDKKVQPKDRIPIIGIRAAIVGMKEGGTRKITLPPSLAFGAMAKAGAPPNSVVIYEITVISVK